MPTILLKKSDTPGSVPGTANLTNLAGGVEVAVNTADKRMFSMTSASAVIELGTNPSSLTCADASFTVARVGSLTISSLSLTNATFASATITNLTSTSATISSALTLSGGTANGVLYLNGSKVATSGSALTFDGTNLGVGVSTPSSFGGKLVVKALTDGNFVVRSIADIGGSETGPAIDSLNDAVSAVTPLGFRATQFIWRYASSEAMRLTSTGLGIGTSSPGGKLEVALTSTSDPSLRLRYNSTSVYANHLMNGGGDYVVESPASNGVTSGNMRLRAGADFSIATNNSAATSPQLTLDSSGNLGLGVTPSAWSSGISVFEFGTKGGLAAAPNDINFIYNSYYDGVNSKYRNSDFASYYQQAAGQHRWYTAPSGTAGNTISFTQAMTLDASGNLSLGTTGNTGRFDVRDSSSASRTLIYAYNSGSGDAVIRVGNAQNGATSEFGKQGVTAYGATAAGDAFLYTTQSWSMMADAASGVIKFATGGNTERMRLDSAGRLAIGRTSATYLIDGKVASSATNVNAFQVSNDANASLEVYLRTDTTTLCAGGTGNLVFANGGAITERARITSGGDLLVNLTGFTYSNEKFAVLADNNQEAAAFKTDAGATTYAVVVSNTASSGDNKFIAFATESTDTIRGSITYNRTAGLVAYNTTSDVRLKENIADAEEAGSKIDAMQVRQFDWKETGSHLDYGFVAQELHAVAPHAVSKPEDDEKMWSVDYSKLVPMLVKEIQSLRARVAQLEGK